MNGSIVKKSAAKLVAAAAVLCGASAALAASTNEFAVIDIMETVRQSEVESPFTATFTGEQPGSVSMQLFDGDLTADNTKADIDAHFGTGETEAETEAETEVDTEVQLTIR